MPHITRRGGLVGATALLGLMGATPVSAQSAPGGPFVTRHSATFNGQAVDYVATVGETVLHDAAGVPTLRFVTTSYVRQGVDSAKRPVLFAFNGGPSSASSTLHMVALGPKRIGVTQDPDLPAPSPPTMADNTDTVLDVADLVFIDPAETGFTRILPGGRRDHFYSANGDAQSVSDFVQAWSRANGREASPKYVLGESYGTLRAALMAGQLAGPMPLEGVFLFGQAVNMIETSQRAKNVVAYATNLPALAAIAAYHGRADLKGKSMPAFIDEVYAWAMGEYLQGLVKGRDLPAGQQRRIAKRLQALTGVSADYYLAHELVITKVDFASELLRDKGLIVGTYDARYTGPAPAPDRRVADPFAKVRGGIMPMLAQHMTGDLGVAWPMSDYRDYAPGSSENWTWSRTNGIGGPFDDYDYQAEISKAFKANPRFRLMIGTGIYDLTTTVGPARYLVAKSDYPADRVIQRQYEGGHMAYTNAPALTAFCADIRAFVTGGKPT
jgi:carboxypeptidase C (cathepsin A)